MLDSNLTALPNLLVILHPICIVDVSGIDDSSTLERTFLATLWEHGYGRNMVSNHEIILSLKPFQKDRDYSKYLVMQESAFSLSTDQNATGSQQPSPLFKLCAESTASGTFQMFVRIFPIRASLPLIGDVLADRRNLCEEISFKSANFGSGSLFQPRRQVAASRLLAIAIVSRNDGRFLFRIHLKDVQTLESLLNHIVQELQVIQYYFHPDRPTDLASSRKSAPDWKAEKNLDFVKYFENDINSNGHLTLSANVYKAKLLLKQPIPVHSSDVCDIASFVGQKKRTQRIVKVYARRESDLACMVDLTGIEHPTAIRQRIAHALTKHNYLIRGQLLLTDKDVSNATSYEPLTDEQLFVLCFSGENFKDILGVFAEVSEVVFAHEDRYQDFMNLNLKTIMSNISVKITDWESGRVYGRVSFDGHLNPYDCYNRLIYKVREYIKERSIIMAFGPEPDFLFSLDARLLSEVLHLKGDKNGTLAISIILDSDPNYWRWWDCCDYLPKDLLKEPAMRPTRKGRLRRWLGSMIAL